MALIIPAILLLGLLLLVYRLAFHSPPLKLSRQAQNAELIKVLLNLDEASLRELFQLYRAEFGSHAARYARQTYHKWQAGMVRPNTQTFNRLLIHLPRVMSFGLKCEVLKELREAYCADDHYQLTVYTDDWKETLTPLVTSIIERAYTAELPPPIAGRLRWLADEEMHVARALLAESQALESRNAVALLNHEFSNIEQLLAQTKGTSRVTHLLKLPYGTITLKIKRRKP